MYYLKGVVVQYFAQKVGFFRFGFLTLKGRKNDKYIKV